MGDEARAELERQHLRLNEEQRAWLAQRLVLEAGRDRHLAERLGREHHVTAHWVRKLALRETRGERPAKPGRPALQAEVRARVRALVEAQLEAQGEVGWRPVLQGIRKLLTAGEKVSVMLVQQETTAAKRERRVKRQRAIEEARAGHEVLCREAVWAQDATHAGRFVGSEEVSVEVATDRGSSATVIAAVGAPSTGEDIVGHLKGAKEERGCLPLVLQTDRGSAYTSVVVAEYLECEQVIHLRSRVHTPTDNPVAENRNRELKAESGLGKGVVLASHEEAQARLMPARRRLDAGRLRASRGYATAAVLDRVLPRAEQLVDRAAFYSATRSAMAKAVLGLTDEDEIAKAEQDAVWSMLERHGLARPRRGRQRVPCPRLPPVAPTAPGVECPGGQPE